MVDVDKRALKKSPRFSEEMIRECLLIMESGDIEELFEIIPRLGVLRDRRFYDPLLEILFQKDIKRREFAAYSLGAIGDRIFLEPLKKTFLEVQKLRGFAAEELQVAVIEAIGAIGDDAAVDFFLPLLKSCCEGKSAGKKMSKWVVESLGAIAQQGGPRSLKALFELAGHHEPEIQAQALLELSVAYWHRPNEVGESTLKRIFELTSADNALVAEAALAALQNLADVGCRNAEKYFSSFQEDED